MPYKDPELQRACKARWRERNREAINADARDRKRIERAFKQSLLDQFNCSLCGLDDPDLIQWHHVVPSDKSFGIKANMSTSDENWWNEVLKCIPVCGNCHIKIHKNKLCLLPIKK